RDAVEHRLQRRRRADLGQLRFAGDVLDEFEFVHWASPCKYLARRRRPENQRLGPSPEPTRRANRRLRCLIARQIPPQRQGLPARNSVKTQVFSPILRVQRKKAALPRGSAALSRLSRLQASVRDDAALIFLGRQGDRRG